MPDSCDEQAEKADEPSFGCKAQDAFHAFAQTTSKIVGSPWAFLGALAVIAIWALTGPAFHFSDTWQLVINTGTTIVTFLMVFLIQNTQNRDAKAIHLKLDELIHAMTGARDELVDLEKLSDGELETLEKQFEAIRSGATNRTAKLAAGAIQSKVGQELEQRGQS